MRVGVGLLTGWLGLHGPALADQYSPAPRIIQQIPFPGGTWTFIDLEQTALRTAMYWRTYLTLVYEPQAWAPGCLDGHWYPNLYFGTLTDRTWPPFRFGKFRSSAPGDGSLWSMWRMHVLPSTLKVDPLPDAPPPSAAMEVTGGAVNDTSILNLTCVYAQISAQQTFPNGIRPQRFVCLSIFSSIDVGNASWYFHPTYLPGPVTMTLDASAARTDPMHYEGLMTWAFTAPWPACTLHYRVTMDGREG